MSVLDRLRAGVGDRYEIDRQIGEGGMATVYLATDRKHDRAVAIKVFKPDLAATVGAERFLREIELSAKLQHPHIVPLYDSGAVDGLLYYVMPFVEGESLRDRLAREGRIPFDEAVRLAGEVASALAYAHARGIVHRDIKPENIMLSGGHAVVADFGIARAIDAAQAGQKLTGVGFAVGTPAYMSPEQATASAVGAGTDQYSLACVFYEMASGEAPFTGPTVQAVLTQALTGPRPRLTKVLRTAPADVDAAVVRALDGDPARRFGSVTEFADALQRSAAGGSAVHAANRRLRYLVAALGVALVAVVAGWAMLRGPAGPVIAEAESIAVLPFSASGAGVELLGEGMVDLLSTNLNAVGGIRAVEPRLVLARWRKVEGGAVDVAGALELARGVRANAVVLGSIVGAGTRVRISATLHGPTGETLAQAQVDGAQDSVLALVDDLSAGLVREIWRSSEPVPSLRVGGITTGSLEAMRAYLAGERYYRRSIWDSAQAAFRQATELDSTFSLAHFRLAATLGWQGGYGGRASREAVASALRFASRLPARERSLVVGYDLFSRGRPAAVDSMQRYVTQYPDDVDGWFVLGEALYHGRPINGLDSDALRAPFDRVLALDSSLAPAAIHPAEVAVMDRDQALLDRYVGVMRRAGSPEEAEAFEAAGAIAMGHGIPDSALYTRLGNRQGAYGAAVMGRMADPDVDPDSLLRFSEAGFARGAALQPAAADQFTLARATTYAGMGRFDEAYRVADSLRKVNAELGMSAMLYPMMVGIAPERFAARERQAVLGGPIRQPFQALVVAQIQLSLGDAAVAERLADSMLARDSTAVGPFIHGLFRAVKGHAMVQRGDTAPGVRLLRAGIDEAGPDNAFLSASLRLALAAALAARPDTRPEGIRRLANGFRQDMGLGPYTSLLLGRAYEGAGDTERARASYGRFVRLWNRPSPGAELLVDEARRGLERLAPDRPAGR